MIPDIRLALAWTAVMALAVMIDSVSAQSSERDVLTREMAFSRALSNDPGLNASAENLKAAEAGLRQAGRVPNPTLDLLTENISGTGPYRAFDRSETTFSLSQPLELGGDRSARRELARAELDTARLSSNTQTLDLLHEVELAFIDAQAAEATLAIANERLSFARNVSSAVSRRVSAARDPLLASARAEAGVAGSEVEVERASLMASAARSKLASYWSGTSDFKLDHSSFERVDLLPARPNQDSSPDISLLETKRDRAKSGISLETAHAIPDPRLSTGFRQFEDTKDTAWVVGLSVPLPLWDRNSGAIARARAEYASASYEVEAGRRALARQEVALIAERDAAKAEIEALQSRVIPRSEEALSSAREGYASGGLSYLDVLDAQRSLSDAQLRRLSVLTAFHRAQARLARLSGAHSSISSGEEKSR